MRLGVGQALAVVLENVTIGAKDVFVMMHLFAKDGTPKLVPACTYPLTGVACVSRIYSDVGTFAITRSSVVVVETFGTTVSALSGRLDVPVRRVEDQQAHG